MQTRALTLGHSPDPDDAFMFYALAKELIPTHGFRFQHILQDIQTLNERATRQRVLRPLGCFYWGATWTLAAWCELRGDFRSFRVDRIEKLDVQGERFRDEPGKTLADLFRREADSRDCTEIAS